MNERLVVVEKTTMLIVISGKERNGGRRKIDRERERKREREREREK